MQEQKKTSQISWLGVVMVMIIALVLIKTVVFPAWEITQADSNSRSGDFDEALEVFEKYVSFGTSGEDRIQELYVIKGDYYYQKEEYSSAIAAYQQAIDRGADILKTIGETYDLHIQNNLDKNKYSNALTIINNAELDGYDMSEKKKEVYFGWAKYEYAQKNYESVIENLKNCEGYPGAEELMQEMRRIYDAAVESGDVGSIISLSLAFGEEANVDQGIWNTAQETLGEYKDWLSVNGTRFIVRKGDGTAFVYGKGSGLLNVSGWSNLKGVYCYGSGAFGWTNRGNVFSTGMYSAGSLGFSDIVQMVGDESRVFGLQSDGTVLCYTRGRGTSKMDFGNVKRLAMSQDGRIAMLSKEGVVCYEVEKGVMDTSNTGVADAVFTGNTLTLLYLDGAVSEEEDVNELIEKGESLLLYPSKEFVFAITAGQRAVGSYREYMSVPFGEDFVTDSACLCVGSGDYWELETGCIVYLTQSGDVNVFYSYDKYLDYIQETVFIMNIYD